MVTPELLSEPRWPHEDYTWPRKWNRVGGLIDLMNHITQGIVRFPEASPLRICELGVANGVSTEVLEAYGTVDAVDHFLWDRAKERFAGRANVRLISQDTFTHATSTRDESYFFVYLDTAHEYDHVVKEIRAWLPKVTMGGFLGGHDYSPKHPEVQRAVADTLGGPIHVFSDSSWIVKVPE